MHKISKRILLLLLTFAIALNFGPFKPPEVRAAAAVTVATEAELRAALTAGNTNEVDDGGTITITGDISLTSLIYTAKSLTFVGQGSVTIYATGSRHFDFDKATGTQRIEFQNITLDGGRSGGGIDLSGDSAKTLTGAKIQNCYRSGYYGTAFYSNGSGAVSISYSTIMNTESNWSEGFVEKEKGDLTISHTVFKNNRTGRFPGAVEVKNGTLTVTDSTFENNTARGECGAIRGSIVNVANSTFKDNSGGQRDGGAIVGTKVTVVDSTFENNTTQERGGAIYATDSVRVTGSTFKNNTVKENQYYYSMHGGAIYAPTVIATDSTFENNSAENDGGAIYAGTQATVTGSTFKGNKANGSGGAVYVSSANSANSITVSDSLFENNTSRGNAGAVYAGQNGKITGTTFKNNAAGESGSGGNGGAIYWAVAILNIEDCEFVGNTTKYSSGYGGAIYTSDTVNIKRSEFKNNFSAGSAGALGSIAASGTCNVETTAFTANKSYGASGHGGGAIRLLRMEQFKLLWGCEFTDNWALTGKALLPNAPSGQTLANIQNTDYKSSIEGKTIYNNYDLYQIPIYYTAKFIVDNKTIGTIDEVLSPYSIPKPTVFPGYTPPPGSAITAATPWHYHDGSVWREWTGTGPLTLARDTEFYAYEQPRQYTVALNANGGSVSLSSVNVVFGGQYSGLPDPTPPAGHTFDGWFTEKGAGTLVYNNLVWEPANPSNHTLWAHYTPNTYTVRFYDENGLPLGDPQKMTHGSYITSTLPLGSDFVWKNTQNGALFNFITTPITADIALQAVRKTSSFTVSFSANGVAGASVPGSVSVNYGSPYPQLSNAAATGYVFLGWYTLPEGGVRVAQGMPLYAISDHTLYAHWAAVGYTVRFQDESGGLIETQTVAHNGFASQPPMAARPGYAYEWKTVPGNAAFNFSSPITGNITLKIVWTAQSYAVMRDLNYPAGNQVTFAGNITYNTAYGSIITAPTRSGYVFGGWYTLDVGGERVIASTLCSTPNDHTLYVHWVENEVDLVTVTFVDGPFVVHQQAPKGCPVAPPQIPARIGQRVTWVSGGVAWNFADPVTVNIVLVANWADEDYVVSFDTNGRGTVAPTAEDSKVNYGKTYGTLPTPTGVADYAFAGWYTRGDGGSKVTAATTYSPLNPGNHTLYAQWTASEHAVSFLDADGALLQRSTVAHGARIASTPPIAARPGNTYLWVNTASPGFNYTTDPVTEDMTLKVVWSDSEYTVSFSDAQPGSGGGALTAIKIKYGAAYPALPARTAAGHAFSGWYTQPTGGDVVVAGMPMRTPNNHTLYAHWTQLAYDVVLQEKDSGRHIGTQEVAYGGKATQPTGIDRAGYDYAWEKNGSAFSFSTPITENTTLELVWTAKTYTVTRNLNYPSAPAADPPSGSVTYSTEYGGVITADPSDRPGQVFTGWYTQDVGGDRVIASTIYDSAAPAPHTLFAHWGPDGTTYTVTFIDNESTLSVVHQKALSGDKIAPPAVTAQTGKKVVWKDGSTVWNFATNTVSGDLTLTAEWVAAEYTVKFDTNGHGDAVPPPIAVKHGDAYGILPTPDSVIGYAFEAWYTRGDAIGEKVSQYDAAPPKNHTLYAHWTAEKYIVAYDQGYIGAPALAGGEVSFDGRFTGLPKPVRAGHAFVGWFNKPKEGEPFDGVQIEDNAKFDSAVTVPVGAGEPKIITLYAQWAENGGGGTGGGDTGGGGTGGGSSGGGGGSSGGSSGGSVGEADDKDKTGDKGTEIGKDGSQKTGSGSSDAPNVSEKIRETLETTDHKRFVNGYDDKTLRPNSPINRAEVAAIFFRLLKDPSKETVAITNAFSDVKEDSWYARPVKYLANMGILKGYKDGSFRPEQNITRAEFTAVASRFDDMRLNVEDAFIDVSKQHWAHDYILSAYAKGWISGYPGDIFLPENAITRAEAVAIVNRMLGRRLKLDAVDPKYRTLYTDLTISHWGFADMIEASVDHNYERTDDAYEIWK